MTNVDVHEITVNGTTYVPKDSVKAPAPLLDGMMYCIIRTYSAGVFAGYLEKREGKEVYLRRARRIWRWEGAASLSELSMSGTKKPEECKFPEEMDLVILTEAIEIIPCTAQAKASIEAVPVWRS